MNKKKHMVIGLDFDGTLVAHTYPDIGADLGAFPWLKFVAKMGVKFVLFTMRSGAPLEAAVKYVAENGIELYGVNKNPTQHKWTQSPKAYCHLYIDDATLGIPLLAPPEYERDAVDWDIAGPAMIRRIAVWMMEQAAK